MIITLQPRLVEPRWKKDSMPEQITNPSYILHEKAPQYYWEGRTSLSIKAFFSGRALYTLGKGYYAVDDASYLIVNRDQPYAITIEANEAVESFCLFFEPGLAEEVYCSLVTPAQTLLDDPELPHITPLHFFERTYRHDDLLSPLLFTLRATLAERGHEQGWLDEQFHELVQRLLQVHLNVYKEVEALPALRAATREELYRRLYRAKEYAAAFFDTPITLGEMARVASLSPNHFLRMFKQLFHQTPHQYIIHKRLERAQDLLVSTDSSVTEICMALGFESLSSFSWLFRQRVGCSPTAYRAQKR
jgi:AraC family transcriptional regulator